MMLTQGDIQFMKDSVREVVENWNTTITLMSPLPLDKQPNYNQYLREFNGDVEYEIITVTAERKDIVNNYTNDVNPSDTKYGENDDGKYLYAVPNVLPVKNDAGKQIGVKHWRPNPESVVIIDDTEDRYEIINVRDRIGEYLITIRRYTGDTPNSTSDVPQENIPHNGLYDESNLAREEESEDGNSEGNRS